MTFPHHGNDAGPRDNAFPPEVEEIVDAAWREAVKITYTDHLIHLGNDGPYETDRVLPVADRQRQQAAIAVIAEQTGASAEFIRGELLEAAYAYGQAPGTDTDPDYLAPPDWEDITARWREVQTTTEARRRNAELWERLRKAPSEVQQQFWAGKDHPQSYLISESTLVAAYRAVAERSGIELVTNPACNALGNPILAEGQGTILSDGTFFSTGQTANLAAPAAAPTDTGEPGGDLDVTIENMPASERTSEHAPGPTSAVRRASAVFDSRGSSREGIRPRLATSPPSQLTPPHDTPHRDHGLRP